jgi:WD40 repeat protein
MVVKVLKIWKTIFCVCVAMVLLLCIAVNTTATNERNNIPFGTVTELWNRTAYNDITSVDVSQNGSYVALGSNDMNVYYYNEAGTKLWNHTTKDTITSVAVSDDGNYVAAHSKDYYLYYLDLSGTLKFKFNTTYTYNCNVDLSSNGEYVVCDGWNNNSLNGTIYFFTKNGGPSPFLYQWYADFGVLTAIHQLLMTKSGDFVSAWCGDKTLYLFNGLSYTPSNPESQPNIPKWTFTPPFNANIQGVHMSENAEYALCYDDNSRVYLLNGSTGNIIWTFKANSSTPTAIISDDGNYILVSDGSDRCTLLRNNNPIPLWSVSSGGYFANAFISENVDKIYVLNSSYSNNQILSLDKATGVILDSSDISFDAYNPVFFSKDGTHFAQYGTSTNKIHYYSLNMAVPEYLGMTLPTIFIIGIFIVVMYKRKR